MKNHFSFKWTRSYMGENVAPRGLSATSDEMNQTRSAFWSSESVGFGVTVWTRSILFLTYRWSVVVGMARAALSDRKSPRCSSFSLTVHSCRSLMYSSDGPFLPLLQALPLKVTPRVVLSAR